MCRGLTARPGARRLRARTTRRCGSRPMAGAWAKLPPRPPMSRPGTTRTPSSASKPSASAAPCLMQVFFAAGLLVGLPPPACRYVAAPRLCHQPSRRCRLLPAPPPMAATCARWRLPLLHLRPAPADIDYGATGSRDVLVSRGQGEAWRRPAAAAPSSITGTAAASRGGSTSCISCSHCSRPSVSGCWGLRAGCGRAGRHAPPLLCRHVPAYMSTFSLAPRLSSGPRRQLVAPAGLPAACLSLPRPRLAFSSSNLPNT
jgi:hypothetical protein